MFADNYKFHPNGFKASTKVADIHFTALLFVGLAIYSLRGLYAILAFFLLLAIVYAHEAGHWLVARWLGYRPHRIALHVFAPAITDDVAESLRHECLMAVSGSVVSLVLGGALTWCASFFHTLVDVRSFFLGTGGIAIFWSLLHLLPFLPFDGGRVAFRIWLRRTDMEIAVKRTVTYSQWFCLAIVALALLTAVYTNVWLRFFVLCFVALYLFMIRLLRMPEVLRIAEGARQADNAATVSPPPYTKKSRRTKVPVVKTKAPND